MEAAIKFVQVTPDELKRLVREAVREELAAKPPANDSDSDFVRSAEAAKLAGITVRTLYNYASKGKIPHYDGGDDGQRRYRRSEILAWRAAQKRGA